jgi:predicted lactoylglutathione lyase
MSTKTFVNPPVKNLNQSDLFNSPFTDETAASLVPSEDIYAMLPTHEKFAGFNNKRLADGTAAEARMAIAVDSKAEVDPIADAAGKAGRQEAKPTQHYGFMQLRSFFDLDGHHWDMLYMDPAHVQPQT